MQKLILLLILLIISGCTDKATQLHLDAKREGEVCYDITNSSDKRIIGSYCLRSMD